MTDTVEPRSVYHSEFQKKNSTEHVPNLPRRVGRIAQSERLHRLRGRETERASRRRLVRLTRARKKAHIRTGRCRGEARSGPTKEVQHDVIGLLEKLLKKTRQVPNVSCWTPFAGTVNDGAVYTCETGRHRQTSCRTHRMEETEQKRKEKATTAYRWSPRGW